MLTKLILKRIHAFIYENTFILLLIPAAALLFTHTFFMLSAGSLQLRTATKLKKEKKFFACFQSMKRASSLQSKILLSVRLVSMHFLTFP